MHERNTRKLVETGALVAVVAAMTKDTLANRGTRDKFALEKIKSSEQVQTDSYCATLLN